MSKTCKKLLASVLAVTMLFSTMISALVVSAEAVNKGTFTVGTTEIEVGDTTAELDLTIAFCDGEGNPIAIKSPHDMFTLTAPEGFTLDNVVVKSQKINDAYDAETNPEGVQGKVKIETVENGGTNLAAGKVILESPVDESAPEVTDIVLTATYIIPAETAAGTYEIAVESSLADWYEGVEGDIALTDVKGSIVVKEKVVCEADTSKWITDADKHWHACVTEGCDVIFDEADHEFDEGVITKDAEVGVAGEKTYTCEICKYAKTEEIPAIDAPTVPEEIVFGCAKNLSLGSSIAITYQFRNRDTFPVCERIYAVVTKERYSDDSPSDIMETEIDCELNAAGTMYSFTYKGLAAKEMGKTVTAMVYGADANGNILFKMAEEDVYGIVQYATSSVAFGGSDRDLKICLADMLNYGAAAQVNFNYNTNDLVNKREAVEGYIAEFETKDPVDTSSIADAVGDQSFQVAGALSLNSSIDLIAVLNPTRVNNDTTDLSVVFKYRNTKENKDYEIKAEASDQENFAIVDGRYYFYCRTLAAAQVSDKVEMIVYRGDEQLSKTTIYSVESYCDSVATTNTKLYNLCQMLMKYGKSAGVTLGY